MDKTAIRDAATLILLRDSDTLPSVLMGQRGAQAAFMPGKFVFPGGAVDAVDHQITLGSEIGAASAARLAMDSALPARAVAAAAVRELWEETGLILGAAAVWDDPPQGWRGFARAGFRPAGAPLDFVFRAVTPPGRPRRFDARFLLADAAELSSDPDDFSRAEDELNHLQWVPLKDAQNFDLPFITQVVLAEIAGNLHRKGPPETVPFVRNEDEKNMIDRLAGKSPI